MYNDWLSKQLYPNDSLNAFALDQFNRGQKIEKITNKAVVAEDTYNNFLLFDYCDWKNLVDIESISQNMFNEIADTAARIWNEAGEFDLNVNNILVKDDDFRFIDFEFGKCNPEERLSRIQTKVNIRHNTNLIKLPDIYYHPMSYWAHMITFRCQSGCEYCIVDGRGKHKSREELSGKEILDWWNGLYHPNTQRLSLIGGETTLHPDLIEIVNNLDGYNITITTNCQGKFFEDEKYKQLKQQPNSTLRINTSYHPHAISPEKYIERVKRMRDCGLYVDQVAFVYTPDIEKYRKQIEQVREALPELKSPPFLGFWTEENGYAKDFAPEFLYPNEDYWDQDSAKNMCGIHDYDFYREMCGQEKPKTVWCPHGVFSLIIDPSGDYFGCHFKLYYDLDPICNIKNFRPIQVKDLKCNWSGFTNWCDIPRLEFGMKVIKAKGIEWMKEIKE